MAKNTTLSIPSTHANLSGVLEKGCEFEGKLCFQGTLRIGGIFRGEIYTPDVLVVGDGARVSGEIDAGVVIINGEVNANVKARQRVEIHAPAIFRGNIITPSLQVDEGVIFEGSSKMVNPSLSASTARSILSESANASIRAQKDTKK